MSVRKPAVASAVPAIFPVQTLPEIFTLPGLESSFSFDEVSRHFRVSHKTLSRWIKNKRIGCNRLARGNYRFTPTHIRAFSARTERKAA